MIGAHPSYGVDAHAEVDQLDVDGGRDLSAHQIVMRLVGPAHAAILFVAVLEKTMEKREMNRIDIALVSLEVIALVKNLFNADVV